MNKMKEVMRLNLVVLVFLIGISSSQIFAQKERSHIRAGNEAFAIEDYGTAEKEFKEAVEKNYDSKEAVFNLGTTLYKKGEYEEAIKKFETLSGTVKNPELKAKVYHNLGNSQLKNKKYKEAVESYKNALRSNPKDEDTRYNLAYAQEKLKQEDKEGGDDKDKKDQDKKDDKENKDKKDKNGDKDKDGDEKKDDQKKDGDKDDKNKEGDKKDQEKGDQGDKKEGEQKGAQPNQLSKEDAQRILEALQNEEKEASEKMKLEKVKTNNSNIQKDW